MIRPGAVKKKYFESTPFSKTHVDLIDYARKDVEGKRYFLSFVDSFTGYCDGIAISNKTDGIVAKSLLTLILRNGATNALVSDNGLEFSGPAVRNLLQRFNIRHCTTSAYYSRSNAVAERTHREINTHLRLLDATHGKWSLYIPEAMFYTNALPRKSLDGLSAFECLFGRPFMLPYSVNQAPEDKPMPFQKALQDYLAELHPALLSYQIKRHAKLLEGEKRKNIPQLEIGSRALVYRPDLKHNKLSLSWDGPYEVIRKRHENSYSLRHLQTQRVFNRHISHIRPLPDRNEEEEPEQQEINDEIDEQNNELIHKNDQSQNDQFISNYFLRSRNRDQPEQPSIRSLFDEDHILA